MANILSTLPFLSLEDQTIGFECELKDGSAFYEHAKQASPDSAKKMYSDVEELRRFLQHLICKKFMLDCGRKVTFGYYRELQERIRQEEARIRKEAVRVAEAKGVEKGLKAGEAKGIQKGVKEMAKGLKGKGVDVIVLSEISGLTKEEIEEL